MRAFLLILCSLLLPPQQGHTQVPELLLPVSHSGDIRWMRFADEDRLVVTYGYDNTLKVWDIRTGWLRYSMGDDSFAITQALPLAGDDALLLACSDGALRKLSIRTGAVLLTLTGLRPDLIQADVSEDGRYAATADKSGAIALFDLQSNTRIASWDLDRPFSKKRIRFRRTTGNAPATHLLADVSWPYVAVWDIGGGREVYREEGLRSSLFQNEHFFAASKGDTTLAVNWLTGHAQVVDKNFFVYNQDLVKRRDSVARQRPNVQRVLRGKYEYAFRTSADTQWVLVATYDSVWGVRKNASSISWRLPFNSTEDFEFSNEHETQVPKFVAVRQRDKRGAVIELATGRVVVRFVSRLACVFSSDERWMITEYQGRIQVHDLERGNSRAPSGNTRATGAAAAVFGEDNAFGFPAIYIACRDSTLRRLRVTQLQDTVLLRTTAKLQHLLAVPASGLVAVSYGTSMEHGWEADTSSGVTILKPNRAPAVRIRGFHSAVLKLAAHPSGQLVAGAGNDDLFLWSEKGKLVRKRQILGNFRSLAVSPKSQLIAVAHSSYLSLLSTDSLSTQSATYMSHTVPALAVSPDGRYLAMAYEHQIRLRETAFPDRDIDSTYYFFADKHYLSGVSHGTDIHQLLFSSDGTRLVSASKDRTAKLWDFASRTLLMVFQHTTAVKEVSLSKDGAWLLTTAADGLVRLWSTGSGKLVLTIVVLPDGGVVVQTPEQYYYSSRNAAHGLRWKLGKRFLAFDQLDLLYNRPHRVLAALGGGDPKLLDLYHKAFLKRIRRFGFDTSALHERVPPEVALPGSDTMAFRRSSNLLPLRIMGYDSLRSLVSIHVWINGVPLYGVAGHSLRARRINVFDTLLLLPLSMGDNHIECSVVNEEGIESYRSTVLVSYEAPKAPAARFHFVGIGIDRFADSRYNLRYSAKDIRDLCVALRKRHGAMLSVDTLLNENVTTDAVARLHKKLLNTDVGDKVLLAYSGHGLVGKDQEFFLSSFDVRFNAPEQGGIPYAQLEGILDSIPARQKLLLLDACHSGEIDRDNVPPSLFNDSTPVAGGKGIRAPLRTGTISAFELMQQAFANTLRRSGTTVLSGSAGTQQALERNDLHNGVFTWAILEWMRVHPRGTVRQLCQYIPARVAVLTGWVQVPVLRNENLLLDWGL